MDERERWLVRMIALVDSAFGGNRRRKQIMKAIDLCLKGEKNG